MVEKQGRRKARDRDKNPWSGLGEMKRTTDGERDVARERTGEGRREWRTEGLRNGRSEGRREGVKDGGSEGEGE
jgi:hypothetical protein